VNKCFAVLLTGCCCVALTGAQSDAPSAQISNGGIRAKLLLPDTSRGYYRGTRFDWAGVIASLEYKGHNYFGQWFEHYEPTIHDAITGPVEEFLSDTKTNAGLGYAEAKPGGTFIKIGVGVLRKPDEPEYHFSTKYEIVDPGEWRIRKAPEAVRFTQTLNDRALGYAYLYNKTVRLTAGKPELVLDHTLKNTGKRAIDTFVYDHNMFVIDGTPSGPDFTVRFPFDLRVVESKGPLIAAHGREIVYLKELPPGQPVWWRFEGFGADSKDYDIAIENHKTGAGVRIRGDQPLARLVFWSIRTVLSPEAFIHMHIEPGQQFAWRISYDFYTL
jgi:hypothetical protein